jgi:hypothetical protein
MRAEYFGSDAFFFGHQAQSPWPHLLGGSALPLAA